MLVQDVVLKLLRRNEGKAELALNALIGNPSHRLRQGGIQWKDMELNHDIRFELLGLSPLS